MKYKISILFTILILSSCSISEFTVNKRLYNKGFYVDFNNKNDKEIIRDTVVKINKTDKIAKISQIEKPLLLNASTEKDVKSILIENTEIKKEFLETSNIIKTDTTKQDTTKKTPRKVKLNNNESKTKRLAKFSLLFGALSSLSAILMLFPPHYLFFIFGWGGALIFLLATIIVSLSYFKSDALKYKWMAIVGISLGMIGAIIWSIYTTIGILAIILI